MRKSLTTGARKLTAIMALLGACTVATATFSSDADDEDREIVTLSGDHQTEQFLAGKRVEVTGAKVADDIFSAGKDLIFDTVSAKYIFAAGSSLHFKGVSADNLILAGGELDMSGDVVDDVIMAGKSLHLTNDMRVGDDARLAGRDIIIDGRIGGNLDAAAQNFRLSGEVSGTARIKAERIVLTPDARINGDLLYAASTEPEVPEGAVISGQVRKLETDIPFVDEHPESGVWYGIVAVFGYLLALILLGAVLQLVMPGVLSAAAASAIDQPWASLGRGIAFVILVPIVAVLLLVTIVGVPIGLVTLAAFFVLLALAYISICYCIGLYARGWSGSKEMLPGFWPKVLWTAVGILILSLIGLVPFIGWAISMLAMIAGLGAVASVLGRLFRKTDAMTAKT